MVKFHWQIYMVMLSEQSKMCSCKWRTLTKWFDKLASCRRGKCDKLFLVCWHLAKMRNTINTLCLLYKVFEINVMCGTRSRLKSNDQEPIQLYSISWPKHQRGKCTHNRDGTKTNIAQAKSQGDSSFEQRGKKESRAYEELLQVK